MGVIGITAAWQDFKFPVYEVGDLLFSEKNVKVYEVKEVYKQIRSEIREYILEEMGKGYETQVSVLLTELLFMKCRKATKTEILLYG